MTDVLNMVAEWEGPVREYAAHGMQLKRIPVIDFTPPSLADIEQGADFIHQVPPSTSSPTHPAPSAPPPARSSGAWRRRGGGCGARESEAEGRRGQVVERGGTVYVHCKAGRGRSASVCMAFLIKHRALSPRAAQRLLTQARPHVLHMSLPPLRLLCTACPLGCAFLQALSRSGV